MIADPRLMGCTVPAIMSVTTVLRPFMVFINRDYLSEPFTHSHLSQSATNFYQSPHLLQFIASSPFCVFDSLFAQPLTKSSGLYLSLEPFTSYSIHFLTESLSSFHNMQGRSQEFHLGGINFNYCSHSNFKIKTC